MAITGTGTEQDPFVVHDYSEFISLSGHAPITGTEAVYIKFFDTPNHTIDCNDYGSEFTWDKFTGSAHDYGNCTYHIDLNGCTIKNFLIKAGATMFSGEDQYTWNGSYTRIIINNGSFRNVFMGSATSKFIGILVTLQDVSVSINIAGTTAVSFDGGNNGSTIDNSAFYIVASTLTTYIMRNITVSDTDIELHVGNQNGVNMFPDCQFTDCRVQGKISGEVTKTNGGWQSGVLGVIESYYGDALSVWTNCVIDLDLTDMTDSTTHILQLISYESIGLNTNVICKSHYPTGKTPPSIWNYITHEQIRNGTYLNNAGFTVVEVAGG